MDDDTRARLRRLEERSTRHGEDIAGLKVGLNEQGQLVRAMAPLVTEVATIRGTANAALAKAEEVESDNANRDSLSRANKWQLISTAIAVFGLIATLVTLVFFILQFAGAGG